MDPILFAIPGLGFLFLGSCVFTCCLRRRMSVLEERVGFLEQRRTPVPVVYQSIPAAAIPGGYYPMPSAPPPPQDLEWGVRIA
jgi:hypothetical protein